MNMNTNDVNELIYPFAESILFSDYTDTLEDIAEYSLDEITKIAFEEVPDAISDLPLIKSAVALGKLGWSIKMLLY